MSESNPADYDVLIVGGGPAGLSAALLLGRCLRRVLICDAGNPRNAASQAMHGFLGVDGIHPASLLEQARGDLRKYENVTFFPSNVKEVEKRQEGFNVLTDGNVAYSTRTLIMATGVRDELPDVPGLKDFYGTSIHICPYCDAWEHRGRKLGVLGGDTASADLALELRLWSRDVTLYAHSTSKMDPGCAAKLEANQVKIVKGRVDHFAGTLGQLQAVVLGSDRRYPCDGLFFSPAQHHQSGIAQSLGCKVDRKNGAVVCANDGGSGVKGFFVAGNVTKGVQLALIAAGEGIRAAVAANEWLLTEDIEEGH